jgi:hypothetical protein
VGVNDERNEEDGLDGWTGWTRGNFQYRDFLGSNKRIYKIRHCHTHQGQPHSHSGKHTHTHPNTDTLGAYFLHT